MSAGERYALIEALFPAIVRDPLAAEMAVVAFHAALTSPTRAGLIAWPFPQVLAGEGGGDEPDWETSVETMGRIPSMYALAASGEGTQGLHALPTIVLRVLSFLLLGDQNGVFSLPYTLHTVGVDAPLGDTLGVRSGKAVERALRGLDPKTRAQLGGIVCPVWGGEREAEWEADVAAYGCEYGYHGSPVENFHSILRRGFDVRFARRDAFGEGTYFTSSLPIAASFAPPFEGGNGRSRPASHMPFPFRVVAMTEIVLSPAGVETGAKTPGAQAGIAAAIPESYFLVRDTSYVRIIALFVFTSDPPPARSHPLLAWSSADGEAALIHALEHPPGSINRTGHFPPSSASSPVVASSSSLSRRHHGPDDDDLDDLGDLGDLDDRDSDDDDVHIPLPGGGGVHGGGGGGGGNGRRSMASWFFIAVIVVYVGWLCLMAFFTNTRMGRKLKRRLFPK